MFCGRNSANKIFQAWKKLYQDKKIVRINKLAAQAFCDKNRSKKFVAAWKDYVNERVIFLLRILMTTYFFRNITIN